MDTADRIINDILACMGGARVDPAPAKEAWEQINAYADAKIRADKEALQTGRAEQMRVTTL